MGERRASVLVGAFVVGAIVIGVAAALFFAGGNVGNRRTPVVMVFDGSLRGLTVGAPIALRGVTIGQVTDIDLILDAAHAQLRMEVVGEIDSGSLRIEGPDTDDIYEELVASGLRAQLNTQSLLTGLLYVQLDFHPGSPVQLDSTRAPYAQIPTIPTELEQFRESLESIDYRAIADNLSRIAEGVESFLNNPDTQALPGALRDSLAAVEAAGKDLGATLDAGRPALQALLDEGRDTFASLNETLPRIGDGIEDTLLRLDAALAAATETLESLESAAAPDSAPRQQLSMAMQEVSLAARALRSLARSLEEHPEALLRGRSGPDS